jgi:hypothetical protein
MENSGEIIGGCKRAVCRQGISLRENGPRRMIIIIYRAFEVFPGQN